MPVIFPASCCGAFRPKTPIKNGYFWVFLGISGIGIKWYNKPPPPLFRRSATWDSGARRPPAGRPELLNYEIA